MIRTHNHERRADELLKRTGPWKRIDTSELSVDPARHMSVAHTRVKIDVLHSQVCAILLIGSFDLVFSLDGEKFPINVPDIAISLTTHCVGTYKI